MNYYITGANGFIGTRICQILEDKKHTIFKVDRYTCKFKHYFIRNNPDYFINLSTFGNHHYQTDIYQIIETNITKLRHYINAIEHFDFIKFYNISSSSVTLSIQTPYSASKFIGEKIIESLQDNRFVNVRPYSIYGIGEASHRFIPTIIKCLHTGEIMDLDPDATHDWIYVDDFIEKMFIGHTEIGTGISTKNIDVVKMLEDISGRKLNYNIVDKMRGYDNNNWVCKKNIIQGTLTLYDGLRKTYESIT